MSINSKDLIQETSTALLGNKVRSGLTMLGIIIGIASVIAMLAIGQGAKNTIQQNIQSIGSNLIIVTPGAQRGFGVTVSTGRGAAHTLTSEDADAISANVSSVQAVAPELTSRYQAVAQGNNTNTSVIGTVPSYTDVRNVQVEEGSFVTDSQIKTLAKVAVLGPTTRNDLFGEGAEAIGKTVRINKINFTVIGITKAKGGSGFNNPDDAIYIPISVAQHYLVGDTYVSTISVQAQSAEVMTNIQADITSLLLDRHKIKDPSQPDFSTLNQSDIVATASSITSTFTILLASVAGISLVVGGIGIMNMMLTSVTERTREIGLRKAVGATKSDIHRQFLFEAIAITLVGGFIGVLLGFGVSQLVTALGVLSTSVSMFSIGLSFGVSAVIGIIFGYYPARRAAELNPIEALRYE